jgi:DNA-binding MurR/RpiR family transcriptional regulator
MTHAGEKLPGRQEAALTALLNNPTVRDAAKEAKLSEATLWRYLRDDGFRTRYQSARRDLLAQTSLRLQSDATHAAKVLRDVADDTNAPASARVSAARAILDSAIKAAEVEDLLPRLQALEQAEAARKGTRK